MALEIFIRRGAVQSEARFKEGDPGNHSIAALKPVGHYRGQVLPKSKRLDVINTQPPKSKFYKMLECGIRPLSGQYFA